MKKIVFTGGGTLGHVVPNITLMEEFDKREIAYIGSSGIEKDRLKGLVDFYEIPAVKLVRGKIFTNFKIPFVLISAIRKSKKILKELKPKVVFSKGGYVSLPVCIAAKRLGIPIVAHESDFSFGLANKIILRLCDTMCVNFKNLERVNKKVVYTGPIFPKSFEDDLICKKIDIFNYSKPTILVVGGSLGSTKINEMIYEKLEELCKSFNVIHITGKGNRKIKSYSNYLSMEMTDNINALYNVVDFVIGRSGAGVTAECFYKKIPMILIPLENGSSRGDQLQNARYYESLKVAKILSEKELSSDKFYREILGFVKDLKIYKEYYKEIPSLNGKNKILKMLNKFIKE